MIGIIEKKRRGERREAGVNCSVSWPFENRSERRVERGEGEIEREERVALTERFLVL